METRPANFVAWLIPLAALVPLAAFTFAQLPAGPCFDDSGDLQTAAAVLGIGHPPGYPLYTLAGHIAARILPVEPALAVTLLAWAAGLASLMLTSRLAARAGADPWIATGAALLLSIHPAFRENLLAPEVYAPTLALLLGTAASLLAWRDEPRQGRLLLAVLLAAAAAASRPPVILMLAGLVVAALRIRRDRPQSAPVRPRRSAMLLMLVVACAALPPALSLAYVLARDLPDPSHGGRSAGQTLALLAPRAVPRQPYNYIEAVSRAAGWPPAHDLGVSARLRRAWWLLSGEQFRGGITRTGAQLASRFAVLRDRALPGRAGPLWAAAALAGLVLIARRHAALGWTLGGLVAGNLAFLLLYDARGTAADALPALAAGAIGLAAAAHALIQWAPARRRSLAAIAAGSVAAALALLAHTRRPAFMHDVDASALLQRLDFATLAPGTVIFATWRECTPLGYEQLVRTRRWDVRIVNAPPEAWPAELERLLTQRGDPPGATPPILLMRDIAPPPGYELVEQRGVFRLRARP